MTQGYQEKKIVAPTTSVDFVGDPGPISISGNFGTSGAVTISLTDDVLSYRFSTAPLVVFVDANRLTFTASNTSNDHDITIRWYSDRQLY